MKNSSNTPPRHLLCFSHLHWDFIFQRPQHLLSRFAKEYHVCFFDGDSYFGICQGTLLLKKLIQAGIPCVKRKSTVSRYLSVSG